MSMNKIYNFLGLAQRAGKLVSGEQAVQIGIDRRRVLLLLIAADASSNTRRKFESLAANHGVSYIIFGERALLGQFIGKSPRAVVGVLDRGFANVIQVQIRKSVQEKNEE